MEHVWTHNWTCFSLSTVRVLSKTARGDREDSDHTHSGTRESSQRPGPLFFREGLVMVENNFISSLITNDWFMLYLVVHIHVFVHWTGFTLTRDSALLHQHKPWRFYRVRKVSLKKYLTIKN